MSPTLLFALSLFTGAGLLFWAQPLIAKILLPFLGGAPAVWNICMLFFQTTLLLGYLYVHMLVRIRWCSDRVKLVVHLLLIAAAGLFLPFSLSLDIIDSALARQAPVVWLLVALPGMVGLPFFIVSTCSPLLQYRFSHVRDPYFLFAASNLGSLTALVLFPFVLEPNLTLGEQGRFWALGYGFVAILVLSCLLLSRRLKAAAAAVQAPQANSGEKVAWKRRLLWLALAFMPSSLMLGVTQYISTDLAAVPLLWVIPLALYLGTFILVFARGQWVPRRRGIGIFPGAVLILTFVYLSGAREPGWFLVPLHLLFFFIASLICHGRLADDRPSSEHLVDYYVWIALGGMAGGIFNGIVAPVLFDSLFEYPLAIAGACFLVPSAVSKIRGFDRRMDLVVPLGICLVAIVLVLATPGMELRAGERVGLVLGVPVSLAYFARHRPVRFGLSIVAVMIGGMFYGGFGDATLYNERNFFGVLRVAESRDSGLRLLYHGNTVHAKQFLEAGRSCEPLAYYHREGPLGKVFEAFEARRLPGRVAGVGLGAGAMVGYSRPGQQWTFYEINPAVVGIAQNREYFTYLDSCAGGTVRVITGDARLSIRNAPDRFYGLIVLDAFSSDSIPMHLVTREAIDLYLSKLAPGGMMAFHISNRSLDLRPVLAGAAKTLGLAGVVCEDREFDADSGRDPSVWAVLARRHDDLGLLCNDPQWTPVDNGGNAVFWSDDFSNIVSVLKWFR